MNVCVLVGRLTREVELRRTGNGTAVASFTVAVNRTYGEEQQTDFIPCVIWKAQAENMARYCGKGSRVAVEGRIQSRTYQDNDGKNRTVIELVCNRVQFLNTKQEEKQDQSNGSNSYMHQTADIQKDFDNNGPFGSFDIYDEDIQF